MTKILWLCLLAGWAGAAQADLLAQWGEMPNGTGTPGTNIVTAAGGNQSLTNSTSTYSGNHCNPAVGANYYLNNAGRSPYFSIAMSAASGVRLVENANNGDRIALYGNSVAAAATFRAMAMWASNNFLITDRAMTVTNLTVVLQQRSNANTTEQGVRAVVQQGDVFYVSAALSFGANYVTQSFALASTTWYAFTPFSSGTEVIGVSVPAPSFNNVQAIGYYFTAKNGGAAAGACGALVNYVAVEGFETPAAGQQLLTVTVNNPSWGHVSPTGGTYAANQSVVLSATASNFYTFTGWSGDLGGATNPVTVTMDTHKAIQATFAAQLATNNTPYWWLAQYGLPMTDAGALGDTDGDGLAAWQEYQSGSNPTSAPRLVSTVMTNRTALRITADNDLSASNAANLSRYSINQQATLYGATLEADRRTVTLITTYLPTGVIYTLSVSGLVATNGANFAATNVTFQCAPDLGPQLVNLVGDPAFDVQRSFTVLSNTFWRAININAGSSNGVELAGRQAWEVARFSATYSIYGAGDADASPDTLRFNLDTFRTGSAGNGGTLIAQIRGVNGSAPTADTAGTALGSLTGNSRFGSDNYTFSFDTDNDAAWHDETSQVFSVGADYDWYIVRVNSFPSDAGAGEPEFTSTAMGADDVVLTLDGHTAPDLTAPHPVTDVQAAPTPQAITLSWRQATEDDTEGVLILRRTGALPTATPVAGTVYAAGQTLGDSTVVYQAPGTNRTPYAFSSLTDSGITAGVSYYYAIYACDRAPNYSTAAYTNVSPAVTFWWDGNGGTAGLGGSGVWDTSSALWRSALSTDPLTAWPNTSPSLNEAIFDGTAGTLTNTAGTLHVNDLTFRSNGFQLTNGVLALSGADPVLLTALSGVTGTIGSVLSGTNAVQLPGPGAVLLSALNTYSGPTTVNGGLLRVEGQLAGSLTVSQGTVGGSGTVAGNLTLAGGQLAPGMGAGRLSVGTATLVGGTYQVEFASATGTAGTSWDQLRVGAGVGALDYTGAAAGSITLDVVCASSSLPGFDATQNYSWSVADAGSQSGFSSTLFTIRTNNFAPSLREGSFSVRASGGDLFLDFTAATPVDLRVSVTAAHNPADVGVLQTYTITISNAGPETVGSYFVTNFFGAGASYASSSDGGISGGDHARWNLSGLAAQATRTLTLSSINPVTQSIITNQVTVTPLRADPVPANNAAEVVVSVQCPGAPSPFLPVVANQSVETGHSLFFSVISSNADCAPPAVLMAGGLPSGASFTTVTNAYQVTGSFSWPFAGSPGTYPVRFYSANVTSSTNVFSLLIHVGSLGEATNDQGVPLSQTNWSVTISNLSAISSGNSTLTWSSVAGVTYDIYSSVGNLGESGVTWTKLVGGIPGSGGWIGQSVTASGNQRYFEVVPEGMAPLGRGIWAIVRPSLAAGFSTLSAPVGGVDLRFDGTFGATLASALTGHNVLGQGDEVFILNPDSTYSNLYLDGSGTWRATTPGNPVAHHVLAPGQGLVVLRRQGTAAQPEFRGPVGNSMNQTNVMHPGYNIVGLSEGRYVSLSTAFSSLISGAPAGSYNQTQADSIIVLETSGAYTFLQRLPDGSWLDLSTFGVSTRKFTPGRAYWYYHQPTAGEMKVRF
jgi:autotransporter-associated beta strand protein